MRSSTFCALLGLFPVFISAFSTVLRRDDPSSNSTSTADPTELVDLMALTLNLFDFYYDEAISLSNSLGDPVTAALLGIFSAINVEDAGTLGVDQLPLSCVWNVSSLLDDKDSTNLIASATHLALIGQMGIEAILQNETFGISAANQSLLNEVLSDLASIVEVTGNVTSNGTPLGITPNFTITDFSNAILNFQPTCDDPFANLPDSFPDRDSLSPLTTPYVMGTNVSINLVGSFCPDPSVPVFCQMLGPDPNVPPMIAPLANCSTGLTVGPNLLYVTNSSDPLFFDPDQRAAQQGQICMGPETIILN